MKKLFQKTLMLAIIAGLIYNFYLTFAPHYDVVAYQDRTGQHFCHLQSSTFVVQGDRILVHVKDENTVQNATVVSKNVARPWFMIRNAEHLRL